MVGDTVSRMEENGAGTVPIRRYELAVRTRVIELRRAGVSWNAIVRETGVGITTVQKWVAMETKRTGEPVLKQDGTKNGYLPGYRTGSGVELQSAWYESKLQGLAWAIERSTDPAKIAASKAAAWVYWQAFQVMRMRTEDASEGGAERGEYKKFIDRQLAKEQEKFRVLKRAKKEEAIEMTAEGKE